MYEDKLTEKMDPIKRRWACPQTVMQIWDAIENIRAQKQITTNDRIAKYMHRKHDLGPEDSDRQINFAHRDNLVVKVKSVGCKGTKVGVEQQCFRLPSEPLEQDGHDWYCFECHRGGEVILCNNCHRVYHTFCVREDLTTSPIFICSVCKILKSKSYFKMDQEEINNLLGYTCLRLKEKFVVKKERRLEDPNKLTRDLHRMPSVEDEVWRSNYLLYEKMDLLTMEEKTKSNEYQRLEEFQADAQTIVHNVVIYYGVHSPMADMARQMLRDCIYDLGEIRQCRECYRMSNEKNDKFWFCQPCDPPHELVYAKQKGFPYWPAKVIRKNNGVYDVRFFGGYHQRANIEKDQIRPIHTNFNELTPKRTSGLNKALEELQRHKQLLEEQKNGETSDNDNRTSDETNPSKMNGRANDHSESRRKRGSKVPKKRNTIQDKFKSLPITPLEPEPEDSHKHILPIPPSPPHTDQLPIRPEAIKREKSPVLSDPVNGIDGEASRDEAPSSSSQKKPRMQEVQTPEDNNVVTSSSQESPFARVSVATQTHKKLLSALIAKEVELKNNSKPPEEPIKCNCEEKFVKILQEEQERMEGENKQEKERICQELTERLQIQFEDQKNKELSVKLEKLHGEIEESHRKEEEQLRLAHQQDLNELQERLKQEISETKKKQWCYNCEQEAIYHCCWNTSYCSVECQQTHWHKEHKRTCRRKR